ncbi:MAG: cation diffusion facilitator family transporter [Candidatus Thermoplasmatota archaeon]
MRTITIAIIVYGIVAIFKLFAYIHSAIYVIFAEFLHTLADLAIAVFLLIAASTSIKPPDSSHPFGHRRIENVGALIVAIVFITVLAFEIFRESFTILISPKERIIDIIPISVLLFSMLLYPIPTIYILKEKKRRASEKALLYEVLNDYASTIGALVGIAFISLGFIIADAIASIGVGIFIAINASLLVKESANFLIGQSPNEKFYVDVASIAYEVDGIKGVHELKAEYIGEKDIHLDMHITVDKGTTIEEADKIIERLRAKLKEIGVDELSVDVCTHVGKIRK